ncbi:prenyltransferase/squalene oxidase repeat-containing protein [Thermococcus piezophilus]|uniref:Squalene cyclase C-terminal domain-containing protein n=1 Tax=Thermococcus piezophilus TaxID=1712654 RepID=A0A172WFH1_9EURY|nr:prenyltransferase/squalene oxidase repeat-containing protein [Thermococcus piezophilus]ANF22177.1 hypothetical protein A7C91_02480 [Thermococcus piezophilus]
MRKVLAAVFFVVIIVSSVPLANAKIEPYVYKPTVPDTAFSVLALYETGDYAKVLEGCEWLMMLRTPFDSWGFAYGEDYEAKYTAMAILALLRGERIASGRYNTTINSAAYWLIYKQNPDGSWQDYTDTALALIALREFLNSGYLNEKLPGFRKQVQGAIDRAQGWLMAAQPKNDVERVLGYMALGKKEDLKRMEVDGELAAYRAFALAYMGERIELTEDFQSTVAIAMALYATGSEKYREELLKKEHFGFWGVLHYRVLDLLSASKISGFEDLKPIACPYIDKITPNDDWEKVIFADYYIACSKKPELPTNYSALLPWQIAEVARVKALLSEDYEDAVSYLLKISKDGIWKDFYNTEYVVWVLKNLGVNYDYARSLEYLQENLTWMLETKDSKTGNPIYYNTPTYYFAYAAIVFKEFGLERPLNESLSILAERQYPNGGWPYTQGSVVGLTSTIRVLWALQEAGLTDTPMYEKGVKFLRTILYVDIPEPEESGNEVKLANATFLLVRNGLYIGNSTNSADVSSLDGYVVIYPSQSPLMINAYEVDGFIASEPAPSERMTYVYMIAGAVLITLAIVVSRSWKKRNKR